MRLKFLAVPLGIGCLALSALIAAPTAQAQAGPVTEFKVPTAASGLGGITTGPDGALWFVETTANKIGRMTTSGAVTEYPIPIAGSKPLNIVAGPDGALWFTMSNVNMIGRVTTAGKFSQITIPSANTSPTAITYARADGNLWFSEAATGKVAKLTTKGVITEYSPIGVANQALVSLVPGPLGTVWYADTSDHVGYERLDGNGSGYATSATGAAPSSVAIGDDGAIWYTEPGTTNLARKADLFATATEYSTFYPAANLIAGPDRGLWFTMPANNYVGRMSTAGIYTDLIAMPTASSAPTGITGGPDGNVWVTETNGNKVARILTNDVTATPKAPTAVVLVAYQAVVAKTKVTVNYALTGTVALSLSVKNSNGQSAVVATGKGKTGTGSIAWNRKFKGKTAPKGKYTLTLTAAAGGKSASSKLVVTLK